MVGTKNLQKWEKLYLEVALHIDKYLREQYEAPFIDSYYGPPQLKKTIEQRPKLPLSVLDAKCRELSGLVRDMGFEESRKSYLLKQITAMITSIEVLSGVQFEYLEEVNRYFDIVPKMVDDRVFDTATEKLNEIMPRDQLIAHRRDQSIPRDKLIDVANLIMNQLQESVRQKIKLPANESFSVSGVVNQPWGAYNWYEGKYSSKVELNMDSNYNLFSLLYLVAHEGYTGHHLDHCLKEKIFYRERGYIEHSLILTRVPESVIGEGIAEIGIHVLFPGKELYEWVAETIAPQIGFKIDPQLEYELYLAGNMLRYLRDNSALLLHVENKTVEEVATYYANYLTLTPEEAKVALRFFTHPYWKVYAFTYGEGLKLLRNYLGDPPSHQKFIALLTSQTLPSQLK